MRQDTKQNMRRFQVRLFLILQQLSHEGALEYTIVVVDFKDVSRNLVTHSGNVMSIFTACAAEDIPVIPLFPRLMFFGCRPNSRLLNNASTNRRTETGRSRAEGHRAGEPLRGTSWARARRVAVYRQYDAGAFFSCGPSHAYKSIPSSIPMRCYWGMVGGTKFCRMGCLVLL